MTALPAPVATPAILAVCLVLLSALGPLSIQIFVPALPFIMKEFGVSAGVGQLTITISLIVTGVATLFFGPLSDRFGRRRIVLVTLALFIVSSVACALAPDVETLIAMRNAQALGASAGVVLARAIAADAWGRDKATTILSYLTMAMGLSTLLTPSIGGVLSDAFGWRGPFAFGVIVGGALFGLAYFGVPDDDPDRARQAGGAVDMARAAGRLVASPAFGAYAIGSSLMVGTFFGFVAAAPYLVVDTLGLTATDFGLWFMLMPGGFISGALISSRIGARVGPPRMSALGGAVASVGALLFALLTTTLPLSLPTLFLPALLIGLGNGLSMPNAQAGALGVEPRIAGTASGLVGFSQNFVAAIASQTVAHYFDGAPSVVAAVMTVCAVGGLLCGVASMSLAKSSKTAP